MAGLNVVKNVLYCLKLKYVVTERVFWSNVKSYTGTCRHTRNGCWKVSLLQLSTTWKWFCSTLHWWRDQHEAARILQMAQTCWGSEVKLCLWLPQKTMVLFSLLSPLGFSQESNTWGHRISLSCTVVHPHTLSLSVHLFLEGTHSILPESPSIWAMSYSEYLLLNCSPPVLYEDTASSCSLWVWFNTCHFLNQYN